MGLLGRAGVIGAAFAVALGTLGCGHSGHAASPAGSPSGSAAAQSTPKDLNANGIPDSDPSDRDWPSKMTVVFEDATSPEAIAGQGFMQRNNLLAQVSDDINSILKLPSDITLKGAQCGAPNDFWNASDKAITMCYEDAANAVQVFTKLGDADPAKSAVNTEVEAFYHETGHMVISLYDLPTTGREEDVADQASTYLMLRPDAQGKIDPESINAIRDTARLYADTASGAVDDSALADVHSPDKARMYNFECWAYGADPSQSADLVTSGELPKDRADGCEEEYQQLEKAWATLLGPYLK